MAKKNVTRVNDQIRVPKVRVIDPDGQQLGILPIEKALNKADEFNLDLVEVAPNAQPPVCRIMDFGKYQYERSKKEKEGKKRQHTITVKEIRMRPKTDQHDLETKLKQARKFLEQKNKVKFSVIFRGRELAYQDMGREMLDKVFEDLEDIAQPESEVKMEGRRMTLMLAAKS
ncbi:translation initiation factor IF-3 [Candidatus Saccharibacteria bacterium]|nr:translation initiation factor IF-3 [Candidatus Saccharibacteria bacterium]NIV03425.1 translation initiation factor IF-3 [Calditrichia bacterium]NIV71644.1 translation initiation factor IF-3 [Calditrichia bacterium]NIV98263.1 translation initiation factor IF-3 [Candidatus Saccharibacteria bacterium]NIW78526.1 translation initiation factor IF-3 [Calditrichia bacterium]